jgi:hypothetical protein
VAITDGIQPPLLILEREWHRRLKANLRKAPTISRRILKLPDTIPSLQTLNHEQVEALVTLHVKPVSFFEDDQVTERQPGQHSPANFSLERERDIDETEAGNEQVENEVPKADLPRLSGRSGIWVTAWRHRFFDDMLRWREMFLKQKLRKTRLEKESERKIPEATSASQKREPTEIYGFGPRSSHRRRGCHAIRSTCAIRRIHKRQALANL